MAQVTHEDRCMFETEAILWAAAETLNVIEHTGAWAERIAKAQRELKDIATEVRTYNDQFEGDDE